MPVQPLSFYCSSSSKPVPLPMMITVSRIRKVAHWRQISRDPSFAKKNGAHMSSVGSVVDIFSQLATILRSDW